MECRKADRETRGPGPCQPAPGPGQFRPDKGRGDPGGDGGEGCNAGAHAVTGRREPGSAVECGPCGAEVLDSHEGAAAGAVPPAPGNEKSLDCRVPEFPPAGARLRVPGKVVGDHDLPDRCDGHGLALQAGRGCKFLCRAPADIPAARFPCLVHHHEDAKGSAMTRRPDGTLRAGERGRWLTGMTGEKTLVV